MTYLIVETLDALSKAIFSEKLAYFLKKINNFIVNIGYFLKKYTLTKENSFLSLLMKGVLENNTSKSISYKLIVISFRFEW